MPDTFREKYSTADRRALLSLRVLRELIQASQPPGHEAMLAQIDAEIGTPLQQHEQPEAPR